MKVGDSIFTVKFLVALDPGTKISVIEERVCSHVLQLYPTQMVQPEGQLVVAEGNHSFFLFFLFPLLKIESQFTFICSPCKNTFAS